MHMPAFFDTSLDMACHASTLTLQHNCTYNNIPVFPYACMATYIHGNTLAHIATHLPYHTHIHKEYLGSIDNAIIQLT